MGQTCSQNGGSNSNHRRISYTSPVSIRNAAARGDETAFKKHLHHSKPERFGSSLVNSLSYLAASNGHEGILKILWDTHRLDAHQALKGAIQSGRINIVTWLSDHNELDEYTIREVVDCNEYKDLQENNKGIFNILKSRGLENPCSFSSDDSYTDTDSDTSSDTESDTSIESDNADEEDENERLPNLPPMTGGSGCPCATKRTSDVRKRSLSV